MADTEYTGQEWVELLKKMNGREVKKSLKGAIRKVAGKARKIAQGHLASEGPEVRGNKADWKKGIRARVYPDRYGGGFMITTKARAGRRGTGAGEQGMHVNRFGIKKPIVMWAEEGTKLRRTRGKGVLGLGRKAHWTGYMRAFHFMEHSENEIYEMAERDLVPEVEKSVEKIAKKCGFV